MSEALRSGRVRIRRDRGLAVRPEAEELDGQVLEFSYGFRVDEDDPRYAGEEAWLIEKPEYLRNGVPWWIASGDIEWLSPCPPAAMLRGAQ